jgi:ubiquinone/menaquinone biosynthesis C-methylase UbiE
MPARQDSSFSNFTTWNRKDLVDEYASAAELQPPERAILSSLRDQLPRMKMLDIGVGAGRTTVHFAKTVAEYWGIDYSEAMIAACRRRFPDEGNKICFAACDARDMAICPDHFFSFVLFSFNGIDYVTHQDRLRVFKEVQRVGRAGGLFCFSTHNIQDLHHFELRARLGEGIRQAAKTISEWLLLRCYYNTIPSLRKLRQSPYALVNDGVHEKGLLTYYIRPAEQLKQLQKCGFEDIRIYRLETGDVVRDESELNSIDDPWLYYLCTIP